MAAIAFGLCTDTSTNRFSMKRLASRTSPPQLSNQSAPAKEDHYLLSSAREA